jgi:hypothetical protein
MSEPNCIVVCVDLAGIATLATRQVFKTLDDAQRYVMEHPRLCMPMIVQGEWFMLSYQADIMDQALHPGHAKMGGYTYEQLHNAFLKVAPKDNWKNPIVVAVPAREVAVTVAAIEFFTGGKSELHALEPPYRGMTLIKSPGYYIATGA